jgi:uncharacterized membrane protein YeaQ/YmgE (transglycosylase-associated protein family)
MSEAPILGFFSKLGLARHRGQDGIGAPNRFQGREVFAAPAGSKEEAMLATESILGWIVIGAIAGWLAGVLVKGYGFGLVGNIVVGILGAGIAGLLAPRLGLHTESFGGNIIASLLGALVLLLLVGLIRRT